MSFSDHFTDLNGDGKVTPEEEFETYMILKQASKDGGSSGGGSGRGSAEDAWEQSSGQPW